MPVQRSARRDGARPALALAIALLHALALGLLLRQAPRHDRVLERVLIMVAVPAQPRTAPTPRPPPAPPDPVVASIAPPLITIAKEDRREQASTAPSAAPPGNHCALEPTVAQALAQDPVASSAIAALSQRTRAATGAAMLWNGTWAVAPDPEDTARLARLRPVIAAVIGRTSPDCLAAELVGPRLIMIPAQAGTTMLVVGSGRWRWGDLRATATQ